MPVRSNVTFSVFRLVSIICTSPIFSDTVTVKRFAMSTIIGEKYYNSMSSIILLIYVCQFVRCVYGTSRCLLQIQMSALPLPANTEGVVSTGSIHSNVDVLLVTQDHAVKMVTST